MQKNIKGKMKTKGRIKVRKNEGKMMKNTMLHVSSLGRWSIIQKADTRIDPLLTS
jgi:hypothetical protein